jgi:peptidylprolyl isomerase domain and WD repeat-containing protein 1
VLLQATSNDFIITGSIDGHIKFWKKQQEGIEFVKHYRAHVGACDGEARLFSTLLCNTFRRYICNL